MKVPVKKLEALEADRLELLHDAVFVRALASSVCRTLKIDPKPILEKLPQSISPRLNSDERGINAPFLIPGHSNPSFVPAFLMKPAVLLVLALLIGAVGLALMPELKVEQPLMNEHRVPVTAAVTSIVVDTVSASVPSAPVSSPALQISKTAEQAKESDVIPKMEKVSSPLGGVVMSDGIIVLKARGPSWVKVTDARGIVQLQKTLDTGEKVVVAGVLPLAVVIGRVDALDVEVRGKPFSLVGIAIDNVARFEVK
jgi:cytoskeleton protein RodZ